MKNSSFISEVLGLALQRDLQEVAHFFPMQNRFLSIRIKRSDYYRVVSLLQRSPLFFFLDNV